MADFPKIKSLVQLYQLITYEERVITDVLRQIIQETIPEYCKEKISYNVPFFYGNKSICLIWPATVPRGGIKQGVLFAFWYGYLLPDKIGFLKSGTNKQIFYKIFTSADEIVEEDIKSILLEAIELDESWKKRK
jgi:hypothetical protein